MIELCWISQNVNIDVVKAEFFLGATDNLVTVDVVFFTARLATIMLGETKERLRRTRT